MNDSSEKTYKEQFNDLIRDRFAWSDFFVKRFNEIGVDAELIIANASPMQKKWAAENNVKYENHKEIVHAQIMKIKPEVLFIEDFNYFNAAELKSIRESVPSIKLIAIHCGAPYSSDVFEAFLQADLIITCTPGFQEIFKSQGFNTYLLLHAFEPTILDEIEINDFFSRTDLIFTGSLVPGTDMHNKRIEYIEGMIKNNKNIKLYSEIYNSFYNKKNKKNLFTDMFKKRKSPYYSNQLIKLLNPPVYGLEMYNILSKAKMTFNMHIDIAGDYAGNMRLFEATGLGVCLLTDNKKNIIDIFKPDYEIIVYDNLEELNEKIKWLFNNPEEVKKIAENGQRRTIKDHNYENRVQYLNSIFCDEIKRKAKV